MLVIRRKAGESLLIGESIEIEVIDVTPTRVKLGIKAPASVAVVRKEIRLTVEQNREAARAVTPLDVGRLLAGLREPPAV
jgi:carbon storage regulator